VINIKISNRVLYSFIAVAIIVAIIGVVYAVVPSPGHTASEIGSGTMTGPITVTSSFKIQDGGASISWSKVVGDYGHDVYTPSSSCVVATDTCDGNIWSLYDCSLEESRTCVDTVYCRAGYGYGPYESDHGSITCLSCPDGAPYMKRTIVCKKESRIVQTLVDEVS